MQIAMLQALLMDYIGRGNKMEKDEFIHWLITDYKYPQRGAEILYDEYLKADDSIKKAFQDYKQSREVPNLEIEGYSVSVLQKDHNMNVIASLLTLDYLIKEPSKAKKSLQKGHDSVSPKKNIKQ